MLSLLNYRAALVEQWAYQFMIQYNLFTNIGVGKWVSLASLFTCYFNETSRFKCLRIIYDELHVEPVQIALSECDVIE